MANQFFIVPAAVLELKALTHVDRAVWMALCSYTQWDNDVTHGECYPKLES